MSNQSFRCAAHLAIKTIQHLLDEVDRAQREDEERDSDEAGTAASYAISMAHEHASNMLTKAYTDFEGSISDGSQAGMCSDWYMLWGTIDCAKARWNRPDTVYDRRLDELHSALETFPSLLIQASYMDPDESPSTPVLEGEVKRSQRRANSKEVPA